MALGQPAHLGQRGLAVAHCFQLVSPGAAAAAQNGASCPDAVQTGVLVMQQGERAGGVDDPRLKSGGVDGLQHSLELRKLLNRLGVLGGDGVELGIDARQGHLGQRAVGQQNFFRLTDQETAEAHAGVHLDVGLHHGGAVFRQGVEGQPRIHRGDGEHHVQIQQGFQLLAVGGGAEHQNLLVHEAGPAQSGGLRHLGHGETADTLVPQDVGQGDDPHAPAVVAQHAVDHGAVGLVLDDGQIILNGGFLHDKFSHGGTLPFYLYGHSISNLTSYFTTDRGKRQ